MQEFKVGDEVKVLKLAFGYAGEYKVGDTGVIKAMEDGLFKLHGDEDNETMGATIARVNNEKGEPTAFHIFNPLYADDKRPAGAYLGTFSASYYPLSYRKGFGAPMEMAAERGWPAQVLAWNEGKQAACFIMEVIETAAQEILVTESMKDITVDRNTFEKLMTICERKGLISKPKVKHDDNGNVSALTGGHMWRLMGQGWTNPSEPWVAINNEDRGSLFHVYNILTGAVTHKPAWTDGKTVLNGSALNFNTFTDRLQTVHKVLGDIARKANSGKDIEEQLEHVPVFSATLR